MRSITHRSPLPTLVALSIVTLLVPAPAAGQALVRPVPGVYRGMKQCLACHELSHARTHHGETIQGPEGILRTTVGGESVSIFDPRAPGYATYVAPYADYFNAANVLYTIGGHGWAQRFLTRTVPSPDDPTRPRLLPDNDMVLMGIQWNQRQGRWEDYHGPSGDRTWPTNAFNTRCGACHATGFDPADTTRLGRWVDLGITCEACHGPSSELNPLDTDADSANQVCGQCHTRGSSADGKFAFAWNDKLGGNYQPRKKLTAFLDQSPFEGEHYWADGESKDHHQQWPDFQRSRHAAAGLRCTDCHHPHRDDFPGQLRDTSMGVCLSCHNDTLLNSGDRLAHSGHTDRQATCVDCHMPRTARAVENGDIRSHTFFMIEPQKTREFGIASGCVDCHTRGPGSPKSQRELEAAFRDIAPSFREGVLLPVPDGPGQWTGFALANLGQTATRLLLTLFDPNGRIFAGAGVTNPRVVELGPRKQFAELAGNFFGPLPPADGWVRLSHYQPRTKAFYLGGDDGGTALTGLTADGAPARVWAAPQLWSSGDTRLSLTNASAVDAAVVLTPMTGAGASAGSPASASIPARGRRSFYLSRVFPELARSGYVAVTSNVEIEGQVTALDRTTLASARLFGNDGGGSILNIPHVVSGGGWETRLLVYNPADHPVDLQLQMRRDGSGIPYGGTSRRTVAARGILAEPLSGLIPASPVRAEGSLLVRTTHADDRIQAIVTFAAPAGGGVAALAAESRGRRELTFAHVVHGHGYWTGIALLAPGGANVVIELRDRDGAVVAANTLAVSDRRAGTLDQILPISDVSGGYLQLRADADLFAFELFGNDRGTVLAAVAPQ